STCRRGICQAGTLPTRLPAHLVDTDERRQEGLPRPRPSAARDRGWLNTAVVTWPKSDSANNHGGANGRHGKDADPVEKLDIERRELSARRDRATARGCTDRSPALRRRPGSRAAPTAGRASAVQGGDRPG